MNFVIHNDSSMEDKCIRIITDDGIGYVAVWYYPTDEEVWISDLSVHEQCRGEGYGTALMMKAEEIARTFPVKEIMLSSVKNSWTTEWYKRLGYKLCGFTIPCKENGELVEELLVNLCKEI